MKNAKRFIYNGLILTASALILRTVSVGFNVFITSKTGASGTGLYQLVMSVYSPALTLSSAGVSLASSRLVAEELSKGKRGRPRAVLLRCLIYSVLCSLPIAAALFFLSPSISASWLGTSAASPLLKMLSVGLPFISLSSCINGFFTALRRAQNSATVQLSEQFFKMILTYVLICLSGGNGVKTLLAVVFGNVCSDIFSLILSAIICKKEVSKLELKEGKSLRPISSVIMSITLPVSISSFLRSALVAFEHILIPKGLKKSGIPYDAAMASYGTLTGMAMPIIMFPASFLYSFSSLMIPEMAEAKERRDNEEIQLQIKQILFSFLTFSIGASGLILGYSSELGKAIYGSAEVARYLICLAPLIPFMYLDTAVDSMLKGLGEQIYTMKVNVIDALSSVISVYFLVPMMGIMGYVAVILISELINFSFSIYRLKKVTGVKLGVLRKLPTLILSVIGALSLSRLISFSFVSEGARAIIGISSGIIFYVVFLIVFGVLNIRPRLIKDKVIKVFAHPYNEAKKIRGKRNAA